MAKYWILGKVSKLSWKRGVKTVYMVWWLQTENVSLPRFVPHPLFGGWDEKGIGCKSRTVPLL